jgi:hypothetical protein
VFAPILCNIHNKAGAPAARGVDGVSVSAIGVVVVALVTFGVLVVSYFN